MKIHSPFSFAFVLFYALLGCRQEVGKVIITIQSKQPQVAVKLSQYNLMEEKMLHDEVKTDSVGHVSIEILLQRPVFATLQVGNSYSELYLTPGDELSVKEGKPMLFAGRGAETNNYVALVNARVEAIKMAGGKWFGDLGDAEISASL